MRRSSDDLPGGRKLIRIVLVGSLLLVAAYGGTATSSVSPDLRQLNLLFLRDAWAEHWGSLDIPSEDMRAMETAASIGEDIRLFEATPRLVGHSHVGEVWSYNFGPAIVIHGTSVGCTEAAIPHYSQWVDGNLVVEVPYGIHLSITLPLIDANEHRSGRHTGTNCIVFSSEAFSIVKGNGLFQAE